MSEKSRIDGKKEQRNRGNESEREEPNVQNEDDGKGTPCPAVNREGVQEAAGVIERERHSKDQTA